MSDSQNSEELTKLNQNGNEISAVTASSKINQNPSNESNNQAIENENSNPKNSFTSTGLKGSSPIELAQKLAKENDLTDLPDFESILSINRFRTDNSLEGWTSSEKSQFEKSLYKNSANFHLVAKDIHGLEKDNCETKSTSQCVQHYYDTFRKSRAYSAWKKQDIAKLMASREDVKHELVRGNKKKRANRESTNNSSSNDASSNTLQESELSGSDGSGNEDDGADGDDERTQRKNRGHKRKLRSSINRNASDDGSDSMEPYGGKAYAPARASEVRNEAEEFR